MDSVPTSLASSSCHTRSASILRNKRCSHTCMNSPVGHGQHDTDQHSKGSRRFSQVHSLYGSPRSLLQKHFSVVLPYSFNGPDPSLLKPPSSAHNVSDTRKSHLPKFMNRSMTDKIKDSDKANDKVPAAKIKTFKIKGTPKGDDSFLRDLFMWGEGIEGGILGGVAKRFARNDGKITDALLPRLMEFTGMLDIWNVSCGRKHAGVVTKRGEVFCWGEDSGGALGHKVNMDVPNPKLVESLSGVHVDSIACAANHTCALIRTGEVYAWGDSAHGVGHLDGEMNGSKRIPHRLSGLLVGVRITKIACGEWHTAIVSSSGCLFTFGVGTFGVLGHGNVENIIQPKEVESLKGLRVKSIACGPWHTAAIVEIMVSRLQGGNAGGKLFTWGDNEKGKLGHGDEERRLLPSCVASLVDCDFVQVACGYMLTIGLTVTGMVFTMGSSENGQLGNPVAEDKSITVVEGHLKDKQVKKISSGSFHVVVLTTKGEVYTWGKGANGRLGLGDTNDRNCPTLVESLQDKKVETVTCGSSFSAAICLHKSVLDKDQSICRECKVVFSLTRRKHCCYNCGFAFCSSCTIKRTTNAVLAPNKNKQFRVCDQCFTMLEKNRCIMSKSEIQTPRSHLLALKVLSGQKRETEETNFSPSHHFCVKEETQSLQRQNSVKHGKGRKGEGILFSGSGMQRWGEVSCPPQFTSCRLEYSKICSPFAKDEVGNIHAQQISKFSKTLKFNSTSSEIELTDTHRMLLSEELQRLQAEVRNLMKQCHVKSEKLDIYKRRIDETWSVARAEAAKCKAAKEVIKVLTAKMNAMSHKFHSGGEVSNLKSSDSLPYEKFDIHIPQINPAQEESTVAINLELFTSKLQPCNNNMQENIKLNALLLPTPYSKNDAKARPVPGIDKAQKHELVEQDEPGVYITLLHMPNGKKSIKRVRFSRRHFSDKEAERWWRENQTRVHVKYKIDQSASSTLNKVSNQSHLA